MVIEKAQDFCVQFDERKHWVEAWAAWPLPFMNLNANQTRYRACLRNTVRKLAPADAICAIYKSKTNAIRSADVENILFSNVGAAPFRDIATRILQFKQTYAEPPPPPKPVDFETWQYVRYSTEPQDWPIEPLAYCPRVALSGVREIRDKAKIPRLWSVLKQSIVKVPGSKWVPCNPFGVQFRISAPATCRLNLADIVKPIMDAFISALHFYQGGQLDAVADRIAKLLAKPVEDVRRLLLDEDHAMLGPRAVPHLRGKGLQWSPGDDFLVAGELAREISAKDRVILRGCFFKPSLAL
jgi:hypothetical protein